MTTFKLPEPVATIRGGFVVWSDQTIHHGLPDGTKLHPESVALAAYEAGKADNTLKSYYESVFEDGAKRIACLQKQLSEEGKSNRKPIDWDMLGNPIYESIPKPRDIAMQEAIDSNVKLIKQLAESQAEKADWKANHDHIADMYNRQAERLDAAQAQVEALREALTPLANEDVICYDNANNSWLDETLVRKAEEALAIESPSDALREHDAKLVERIAAHQMECLSKGFRPFDLCEIADKIRKGDWK